MSVTIRTHSNLESLALGAALRLGLEISAIQSAFESPKTDHLSIAAVRSKNDQLVTYPIVAHYYYRNRLITSPARLELKFASKFQEFVNEEVKRSGLFGANVFNFNLTGELMGIQPGISIQSLWSEIFSITSLSENAVRAAFDLPLGSSEVIEDEWCVANYVADSNLDMTHPLLHLFAHQSKYRIRKLTSHEGFVALSKSLNMREEVTHAIDYLEGVINE